MSDRPIACAFGVDVGSTTLKAVVLDGPVLRLGDLFDGLGEEAAREIARAPAPGRRVELDARWLAAVAKGYGVAWRPSSPESCKASTSPSTPPTSTWATS